MSRWLLLVLVVLLPLRGVAGVAMAGQMLEQRLAATQAAGQGGHHGAVHAAPDRALHDCDEHAHHASAAEAAAAPSADADAWEGDCPTCASCQVCSAAVLAPSVLQARGESLPQAPPATAVQGHASAEPVLALKPPRG